MFELAVDVLSGVNQRGFVLNQEFFKCVNYYTTAAAHICRTQHLRCRYLILKCCVFVKRVYL